MGKRLLLSVGPFPAAGLHNNFDTGEVEPI